MTTRVGFTLPSANDFKLQFPGTFPYAVKGFGAVIALTVVGGVITQAIPQAGGYNYTPGAAVNISSPTGSGAVIKADIKAGALITCELVSGGTGYAPVATATLFGGDDTKLRMVTDGDINGAIQDADFNINECLFGSQASFTRAFLWLAAHLLVENIQANVEGLASQYSWLTAMKNVEGVSQSFKVPSWVMEDPFLASLSTTRFGLNYLRIVLPYMVGHIGVLPRVTNPV